MVSLSACCCSVNTCVEGSNCWPFAVSLFTKFCFTLKNIVDRTAIVILNNRLTPQRMDLVVKSGGLR